MKTSVLKGCLLCTIVATPAWADTWSDAEVTAAVTSIDKQYVRECADDAGGTFEQTAGQRDLNGDGINELIVYTRVAGASGCIGRVGQEIDLLISDGSGGWKRQLGFDTHSLNFHDRPDSSWPDIELGGPGFCFPIWRFHQGEYGIWKTCENGHLVFAEGLRENAVPASSESAASPSPGFAIAAYDATTLPGEPSKSAVRSEPVEVVDTRALEGGMPYLHNGSAMWVYPEHGLIVYDKPRKGIANLVEPGTVLFKGRPWATNDTESIVLRGRAFVFRKGCEAAGYEVSGKYHDIYAVFEFTLEGAAPVRRNGSCDIVGHDMTSKSSRLKFEAAWH